ncbi:short-chain dehydrogenase [Amycolatopsis sp. WAC 04169]|uniref:SDR family NAD(P)-dependent oxidoreductase n=1 Tax=Amycolatopsis sp. WAC 04169 TaxID=2203197 RepID=UPI000F76AAC7|nr:SDR family oxidoreductase [Amycolatopsis sp. WAC 04169]RSN19346.1 short-chain dehydrogenase [Amycolatopsis sp. WAC 04169]
MSNVVIIGGTSGIGRELGEYYAGRGHSVVVTGRDAERAEKIAAEIGETVRGVAVDLAEPQGITEALAEVGPVDRLALVGIQRDRNSVKGYDVGGAVDLVTMKLVGYTTVVHALLDRLTPESSVLLFGGMAKDRPYPGSTNISIVNAGVLGMVRTLAAEVAPVRINAIHPGVVGDSPYWAGATDLLEGVRAQTPTGRLVTMGEVVDASVTLLENRGLNKVNLTVDGGFA